MAILPCPRCQSTRSKVAETRAGVLGPHATLRRRRDCEACGHRWWTQELSEDAAAPLATTGTSGELRRARGLINALRREIALFDRREDRYARDTDP
jgi:transcriptional regulator NrdR family protein